MGAIGYHRSTGSAARRLLAGAAAIALSLAGLSGAAGVAYAVEPAAPNAPRDAGLVPDPGLQRCINGRLGANRPADQPILQEDLDRLSPSVQCLAGENVKELRRVGVRDTHHKGVALRR